MCFLLGTPKPGQVLLLVRHYNIKKQFDSGQARPCCRLLAGSHGRQWADAGGLCATLFALGGLGGGSLRAAAWGPRGDPGSGGGPTSGARLPVAQTGRRQPPLPPVRRQPEIVFQDISLSPVNFPF